MTDRVLIRRVRFVPGHDPHAARVRLERDLTRAEWGVSGLPPAAILCVRRLRARAGVPGAIPAALVRLARGAVRAAREFVPAAAEAVWFADNAERLACFARAALAGDVAAQWWWDAPRGGAPPVRAAVREWLAAPADAPATWGVLADWGGAPPFAAALEPGEAVALTHGMASAFGVHPHPAATREWFAPADVVRFVPEARTLPPGPQRTALVLGLLLARAPYTARTGVSAPRSPTRVGRETEARERFETTGERPSPRPPARPTPLAGVAPARDRGEGPVARDRPLAPGGSRIVPGLEPVPAREGGEIERAGASVPTEESPTPSTRVPSSEVRPPPVDAGEGGGVGVSGDSAPAAPAADRTAAGGPPVAVEGPRTADRSPVPERIDTEFGGLLYLVNVALALNLYPDFTEPARAGIALSLWDLLALWGRRWAGPAFLADPLDGLLAALAGRGAGAEPGAEVDAPRDWQLPEPWHRWALVPAAEAWSGLGEWLDWLAPVIAARLAAALGRTDAGEALDWLLRRWAAVLVAPAHLDVVLPLADLAVEIRVAGLDRDPGRLPASGVTVRFHYESHGAAGEPLR